MLERSGHEVSEADSAESAMLAVLDEPTPDVVVSDVLMPERSGIDFYSDLVDRAPRLRDRVIFVTGAVAGTDAERFLEETGCRWLAKPFRLGDLLQAVRESL